jgi:hypothetical protein
VDLDSLGRDALLILTALSRQVATWTPFKGTA